MRTEQASVQPDIGCEERAAYAQHDSTRVVRPRKLHPVPHGLAPLARGELARHLDRLPAGPAPDRQALCLAFAERHPHRLPAAELAPPRGPLRQGHEQRIAHSGFNLEGALRAAGAKAPSAVEQMSTGLPKTATKGCVLVRSSSASMLPPKPAPMMRAP